MVFFRIDPPDLAVSCAVAVRLLPLLRRVYDIDDRQVRKNPENHDSVRVERPASIRSEIGFCIHGFSEDFGKV